MPEAKQKHHTDLSETKSPKRSSPRKRGPKASRSRGKSLAETEPAILDSRSPQWGALAAGCEALRLSKPDERAEAGRALDDAAGDLLFALGHRYYSTGLPDLPGAPRLPQEAAGWADLLRRIERVHKLLGTGPLNSDVAERCEFVLGQFFRAIPWMMRQAESNAAPLPPLPATSYHVEREQPSEDGPGRLPKHRDSTSPTTGPARSEVTKLRKITPKYAARRSVSVFLSDSDADGLAAVAASQGLGLTEYASTLLAAHVAANPKLVEEGQARLEAGWRAPYRTRRMELEEEARRLRGLPPLVK